MEENDSMLAVIKWTLWQRRLSIFWWSVSLFALIFVTLIFYPTFRDQASQLEQSFQNLPDSAVQLLGGSTDFFSAIGYLNSQLYFLTLPLVLIILAVGLGSGLLAKEEQNGSLETILTRPISRMRLIIAQILTGTIIVVIVSLVSLIATIFTSKLVDLKVGFGDLLLATLDCTLLALSIMAISYLITAIFTKSRSLAMGIGSFVGIAGYVISSLAGTVDWLKFPAKFFPFDYYKSEAILNGTYNLTNTLVFIGIIIVASVLSLYFFQKRDLG